MKIGERIYTPRFCTVRIDKIFDDEKAAIEAGFTENTYFDDFEWDIFGKVLDCYHMVFAAVRKRS